MSKDNSIIKLLEKLKTLTAFNMLEVVDYWAADLCAIGLKNGNRLIYISTYNYVSSAELRYDFDLELTDERDPEKITVMKKGRGVSEDELVFEIKEFFEPWVEM